MGSDTTRWWGAFELALGRTGRWRVGPGTLLLQRLAQEWRAVLEASADIGASGVEIEVPAEQPGVQDDPIQHDQMRRFGTSDESGRIVLEARLADRPVVAAPKRPVEIPAGDEITIYVGSTVWVRVLVGEPARMLFEQPLIPLAETWFGPSPRTGELCYASRTHCRLRLDGLPVPPHRALTSVLVQNRADTPLILDAVKLPVPLLALYQAGDGGLWTQDVILERHDRDLSPLRLRQGSPRHASDAVLLTPPRKQAADNVMVRAFSSLFSL